MGVIFLCVLFFYGYSARNTLRVLLATAVVMPNANSVAPDQPAHPQSDLSYTVHLSISNTLFVEIMDSVALRSDCLDVQYDLLLSYGENSARLSSFSCQIV